MNIWYDILFAVNSVSKIIQFKNMHIDVVIDNLRGLITYLKNYRENDFASALESTKEMAIKIDIEPKFNERRKIHRKKYFDDIDSNEIAHSAEDYFRIDLSFEDHSDIDGLDLFSELKLLKKILTNEINTPLKILNYIKRSCSFPNTYIAYRILLTLLIIVATAERSYLKLKLIKSYLRLTMLRDRLNELTILSIESEMLELLDYKTLINNFAAQKTRKIT
uniref:HAT C-terminal dimerisation domain-containing protein n=1 Tax=Cajanus cajan TaxID=3821 RepID=A0A151S5B8_CAJCA|nr:hypothetical protein KK1_028275 [Cajanus cajan]